MDSVHFTNFSLTRRKIEHFRVFPSHTFVFENIYVYIVYWGLNDFTVPPWHFHWRDHAQSVREKGATLGIRVYQKYISIYI